ncbi:hypothetical protein [Burkholderia ubonensis]|uniref:hypothetical protein n=1 Tax=Burkholderia ubonensis TaxID=101571 RepID=UPI000A91C070|nr:hypothetical protein [Burkholderia ubonensis]
MPKKSSTSRNQYKECSAKKSRSRFTISVTINSPPSGYTSITLKKNPVDGHDGRSYAHAGARRSPDAGGHEVAEAASVVSVAQQTAYILKARLDEGGIDVLRIIATRRPACSGRACRRTVNRSPCGNNRPSKTFRFTHANPAPRLLHRYRRAANPKNHFDKSSNLRITSPHNSPTSQHPYFSCGNKFRLLYLSISKT